jgi:hypothetical protein
VRLLDTLPDILDRDCRIGHQAIVRVEASLDAVRTEFYESFHAGGDVEGGDTPPEDSPAAPAAPRKRASHSGELEL